jgi:hypothetical protein
MVSVNDAIRSFIKTYAAALQEESAAVFAGAGLSIPAGMVDWRTLLREIARDVGLDVDREHDLISVAQFHVNERAGRHRVNQALVQEFAEHAEITENHRILASLPVSTYWTTNYDALIEAALREAHKRPDIKATAESLAVTLPRRDAVIYKMHGDASQPEKAVVTRDDYEAYDETRRLFSMALQGDLVSKTFLFLGFSFSDPNLAYILARIRLLLGANRREHYCLLREVHPDDFEAESDYEYARVRQELQVRDLRRYGIVGLLLRDYGEHTEVLRRLAVVFRRGRVFISGSAEDYSPWEPHGAQEFVRALGRELIVRDFGVISGYGVGVGPYVVNGVLDGLRSQGGYAFGDRVVLRPFPQGEMLPEQRARLWTEYRREMLSHAGIAVFVFGNRAEAGGGVERAGGVEEEFHLAREAGLAVVPVGSTGHVAADLHRHVTERFSEYFPGRDDLNTDFRGLAEPCERDVLLARVVAFLSKLREESPR